MAQQKVNDLFEEELRIALKNNYDRQIYDYAKLFIIEALEEELNLKRGALKSLCRANKPDINSIFVGVRKLKEKIQEQNNVSS